MGLISKLLQARKDKLITVRPGKKPLSNKRIQEIKTESDRMAKVYFKSKIDPLKEYLAKIDKDRDNGVLSEIDYQKECELINKDIDDICKEYGIELKDE